MSSQQKAELDALLRQIPLDFGGDLAQQRSLLQQMATSQPLPADVTTTPSAHGGVPAVDVSVPGAHADDVILYFHGGLDEGAQALARGGAFIRSHLNA
jgi:epsilon-lactone hydrolase